MRILLVTGTYLPSINGVAISVESLKKELTAKGHQVFVLAPNHPQKVQNEKNVIRYSSLPNPMLTDYPIPLMPGLQSILKILNIEKPDIVHTHHPFSIGFFASKIADYYRIPLVFTYHTRYDLYVEQFLKKRFLAIKNNYIQQRVDKFCLNTNLIISPSLSLKGELLSRMPDLNIAVIPTGITQIPRIALPKRIIRKKILVIPEDKKVLLTVCRLADVKNLDTLVKCLKYVSDEFLLIIVGDGPFKKGLINLAAIEGVLEKIIFQGKVNHDQLGPFYQTADLFVFPSITETQGLIFLESFSFGLPVVAIDSAAANEWVNKGPITIARNEPLDLALKIKSAFKLNQHSNMHTKLNLREYTASNTTKHLIGEYESLIKRFNLAEKLTQTGWQSWSPRHKKYFPYPSWNYAPRKDNYLPVLDKKAIKKKAVTGWCSFYAYGHDVTAEKVRKNVRWLRLHQEIPLQYILIDDGWTTIGDWQTENKTKFPHGMSHSVQFIKKSGFKPGIWIAPFLMEPASRLFKLHPDWGVKRNGLYVDGLQLTPFSRFYLKRFILDIRKIEVWDYIFQSLDYLIKGCGFQLLKLDFLFSIYFIPDLSAVQASTYLRNFFLEIAKRYPEVYTIACGTPLKPAVNAVDSVRIGPDIISPQLDRIPGLNTIIHTHKLNLINKNQSSRQWTEKYWNLDPDVFVCRQSLGLSDRQILSLQKTIISANGNLFLGDDLTALPPERIMQYILPLFTRVTLK